MGELLILRNSASRVVAVREKVSMGRHREFDPQQVLGVAMQVFWERGYADTSMRDVMEAAGVAHAGMYAEFGSKRELYERVLNHYDDRFGRRALGLLEESGSDLDTVKIFFETIGKGIESGLLKNGCLMGNTVVEFGGDSNEVAISRKFFERMEHAFEGALVRAKDKGQLSGGENATELAYYLTSSFYGIMTMVRARVKKVRIKLVLKRVVAAVT